ncbi:Spx/MgsR family RNA polymerase-binding regulatory protein [Chitinasiproducens palmae]|nr:Spx/MgsR family RNA polymerase-binding regulatory protein [Chitinasiproducens palmae]
MLDVWGIPNCQTVKKARAALEARGVDYRFHDFKKTPPAVAMLRDWLRDAPLETLLNRRGTTWRQLSDAERAQAEHTDGALELLAAKPSLIKRPVVVEEGRVRSVGFDAARFDTLG